MIDKPSELSRSREGLVPRDEPIAQSPDHAEKYHSLGNELLSLRRFEEALVRYDQAIALEPSFAEAYCHRGNALRMLGRPEDAVASYDKAIALKPNYIAAHNNRGTALKAMRRNELALESYNSAIELSPRHAELYNNRGNALQELGRFEEALASYDQAIGLKEAYAEAYSNRAVALHNLKCFAKAIASFDSALSLRPDYAEARWNRALSHLITGRFDLGWLDYEARKTRRLPVGNREFGKPLWIGQTDVSGKTVLVHSEQGFGDTIQFCRYLKLLVDAGASILFAPQEPLRALMRSFEPPVRVVDADDPGLVFDLHCPLMSLPLAFRTELLTIPPMARFLGVDPDRQRAWVRRLGNRRKTRIGIAWSGSNAHWSDRQRSIELAMFVRLFDDSYEFVSLQKELRPGDAALLKSTRLAHFGDQLHDFADTAALCQLMDLVISVDTSIAHLAGTLAKPVWTLLPYLPDWRWMLDTSESPWYPSMRLFRQTQRNDWQGVLIQVERELKSFQPQSADS